MENTLTHIRAYAQYLWVVIAVLACVVFAPLSAHAADGNITATAGNHGAISPSGTVLVPEGTDQTFTMTPDTGYHVDEVLVDSTSFGAISSYTFTGVAEDHTIDVSFAIDQFTLTATAGAGGSILPSGSTDVDYGTDQTFTITPDAGYEIADVLVDGLTVGTSSTYTFVSVTADHTIDATFSAIVLPPNTYAVTATHGANGTITPAGTNIVTEGSDISFTITADAGYEIATLTIDGVTTTPTTTYAFTNVTGNHTIDATFSAIIVPPTDHTITVTSGAHGTVTPSGATVVAYDGTFTLTITPDSGYQVNDIMVDGVATTSTTTLTLTNVVSDHTIDVTFTLLTVHVITSSAGAGGTISPVGPKPVFDGYNQVFTIIPNVGYSIATLTIDGATTTPVAPYTFVNVTEDHTIAVTFALLPTHTITATVGANGTITPSGTVTVTEGADKVFTITPDAGYEVATLTIDGVTTTPVTTYAFTNVQANHTVDATFSAIVVPPATHTITTVPGVHGMITPSGVTTVTEGADQTFTITPDAGYEIEILTIDGVTTTPTTTVTFTNITGNHTVGVSFIATPVHTVVTAVGAHGTISPLGITSVTHGGAFTAAIVPDSGYAVGTLIVDSIIVPSTTTVAFTSVTSDHTVAALFVPLYDIVATSGAHGTITPAGTTTVTQGDDMTYTMTPDSGYVIGDVLVDGLSVGAVSTYAFTNVTGNHTIDVQFVPTYEIVISLGAHGTANPIGTTTVTDGDDLTVTITPDAGYAIATMHVDGAPVATSSTYTFTNVTGDHTLDATFVQTHTVSVTGGQNGTVTNIGTTTVTEGSDFTFTFTPDSGYTVGTVVVDGTATSATSTYTFGNITTNHNASVNFIELHLITALVGPHGVTNVSGTVQVPEGSDFTVTITPDLGYTVASVIVDSAPQATGTSYTFTNVTGDHTLAVAFVPVYTVTTVAGAGGSVIPSGSAMVVEGDDLAVTITPDLGYGIATLIVDGVTTTPTTTVAFTNVTASHTVDATFLPLYDVVVTGGVGGTVTPTGTTTVLEGSDVTVTITPDLGYGIGTLTVDGVATTSQNSVVFTSITSGHTVTVTFIPLPVYTIVATAGENGNITPVGTTSVTQWNDETFTITPAYGYGVDTLTIDGVTTTPATTYTFVNVQQNHTIDVMFKLLPTHSIVATAGGNGTLSPVGTVTVFEGQNQIFYITPAHGYYTSSLIVDGTSTPIVSAYTFTNVQADHTISVGFTQLPIYTITATAGVNGVMSPTGSVQVYEGMNQTFTITPAYGYDIATLTLDGVTTTPVTTYTFSNVHANHSIDAIFYKLPTYPIALAPGANGTITGPSELVAGYTHTYTITPDLGYGIATLTVDGVITTPTTTVTFTNVTGPHSIQATFSALTAYTIVATAGTGGTISPNGTTTTYQTYNETFTITPDHGYGIGIVTVDGMLVPTTTSYTFSNVNANHTIDVTFTSLPTYTVTPTVTGGNGVVTGNTSVTQGDTVTYTIVPDRGYTIGTLVVDGVTTTPTTTVTFTNVTGPHTIDVTFIPLTPYTITASAGTGGSISPSGAYGTFATYNETFTITPDSRYAIDTLRVDGVAIAPVMTYTFSNVSANHSIEVTFKRTSSSGGGSSSGSKSKSSVGKTTVTTASSTRAELLAELMEKLILLKKEAANLDDDASLTGTSTSGSLLEALQMKLLELRLKLLKVQLAGVPAGGPAVTQKQNAVSLTSTYYPRTYGLSGGAVPPPFTANVEQGAVTHEGGDDVSPFLPAVTNPFSFTEEENEQTFDIERTTLETNETFFERIGSFFTRFGGFIKSIFRGFFSLFGV